MYIDRKLFGYPQPDFIDITVKGGHPVGKVFAPNWDMVMGYKKGKYDVEAYSKMYWQRMRHSWVQNKPVWKYVLSRREVVFLCYCKAEAFCHRKELVKIFTKLGAQYMGEMKGVKNERRYMHYHNGVRRGNFGAC